MPKKNNTKCYTKSSLLIMITIFFIFIIAISIPIREELVITNNNTIPLEKIGMINKKLI
tara:strand:+ start:522 stop:698 length:177 start_codon:yes stop_codon:yes gene_type:complete